MTIIIATGANTFSRFSCSEVSQGGLSFFTEDSYFKVGDVTSVKLNLDNANAGFDVKTQIVAVQKVRQKNSDVILCRYSLKFLNFSVEGKKNLQLILGKLR